MNVAELIEELRKMPQDAQVIIFDCAIYDTQRKVYVWTEITKKDKLNDKVVID